MTDPVFRRHALYFLPRTTEPWVRFATDWLGWDAEAGAEVAHPDVPGLPLPVAQITERPRKYGLHATIKAPFRLAPGVSEEDLKTAAAALCSTLKPVMLDALAVTRLGRFLALRPVGDETALNALAGACVEGLDPCRDALTEAELAKRRASRLTPAQDALLLQWGYPYVMDEFHFHITLSGPYPQDIQAPVADALEARLHPMLPRPFVIDELALAGEADDGRFHLVHRYALSG
ncbi:DUF1045 domain-containing protein [Chachezhania sediminis]|uniref:DUF1045 domain-containing protein n=1 Tax=Chachezhania sediminis TaxID=2599291 RepID=UPI00131B5779|nr:DUF1045 domain-containing protein [Chachezhania sediminis]